MVSYKCENSVRIRRGVKNNKKTLDLLMLSEVIFANVRQGEIRWMIIRRHFYSKAYQNQYGESLKLDSYKTDSILTMRLW